ncbi:F-box domain containing protein [Tanacetum coccineum]
MTWHATRKCTKPDKMQHPVDGRAWKNFDSNQSYSMWPVILTTKNLPPWLCMKENSFMLTLLIPGPKSPGKDIDVYLRPLIDDLKYLWALKGVETIDVATGQKKALTFSSHYFRDVTTKFNRPDRNVDCPPPTCQFQVFKSLCKSIGLRSVIRIDHQELKKVICEFPNKDMKEEFPGWFGKQIRFQLSEEDDGQCHVDKGPRMSADVARGHGGDGGGDDRPPPYQVPTGCGGCLGNRGKGTRKPNLGGRRSGQAAYPPGDPIPRVKASRIRKRSGPVPIRFLRLTTEETLMPLGDHLRSLGKYSKSLVRECLALPFFRQIRRSGRRGSVGKEWCKPSLTCVPTWNPTAGHKSMRASIPPQNLQKIYNGKKAALKERYWVPEEDGTYDLERLRRGRPTHISEWRPQLQRDEMLRLQGLGSNTPTGVPYTEDEIMAIVSQLGGASSRGHIPGGWTGFASTGTMLNQLKSQPEYGGASGSGGCGDDEPGDDEDDGEDEDDS